MIWFEKTTGNLFDLNIFSRCNMCEDLWIEVCMPLKAVLTTGWTEDPNDSFSALRLHENAEKKGDDYQSFLAS